MDIVYINQKNHYKNNELRYSLRSIERNISNYDNVFIVGYKPDFVSDNVIHIPADDKYNNRATNIMTKVLLAAENEKVSKDFMLLNDDYFIMKPMDCYTYPYYWKCDLAHTIQIQRNEYQQHVIPTYKALLDRKLPTKNFDTHKPIVYNKDLFQEIVSQYDWNIPYGFILRSIYCNTLGIEGVEKLDDKINHSHIPDTWKRITANLDCFSIGDQSANDYLWSFLNKEFPEPSKYEK